MSCSRIASLWQVWKESLLPKPLPELGIFRPFSGPRTERNFLGPAGPFVTPS